MTSYTTIILPTHHFDGVMFHRKLYVHMMIYSPVS